MHKKIGVKFPSHLTLRIYQTDIIPLSLKVRMSGFGPDFGSEAATSCCRHKVDFSHLRGGSFDLS